MTKRFHNSFPNIYFLAWTIPEAQASGKIMILTTLLIEVTYIILLLGLIFFNYYYYYFPMWILINSWIKLRDKVIKGVYRQSYKNMLLLQVTLATAVPFLMTSLRKSFYRPVILAGSWLFYSCSVAHFLFIDLAVLLSLSFSPSITYPSSP